MAMREAGEQSERGGGRLSVPERREREDGGQTTGEGQSGHVELTQIGQQVTDL